MVVVVVVVVNGWLVGRCVLCVLKIREREVECKYNK